MMIGRRPLLWTMYDLLILSRTDGIVTALCQPNLKFSVPYDISSWGSCLAKCPASKPVPPEPLDKHKLLLLDEEYMTQEKVVRRTCFRMLFINTYLFFSSMKNSGRERRLFTNARMKRW